jgi:hypothetical protein
MVIFDMLRVDQLWLGCSRRNLMTAERRRSLLLCILAILFVFPGTALAGNQGRPAEGPEGFTIVGYTTSYDPPRVLPSGRAQFHLTAGGSVTPHLEGSFHFEEWGIVDLDSGEGTNHGIMTIFADGGEVIIRFGGQSTAGAVSGQFTVLQGTGAYRDLHGRGTYTGVPDYCDPGLPPSPDTCTGFYVDFTFTRSFHSRSR